jgi:ketosteroid isomerase-like protein
MRAPAALAILMLLSACQTVPPPEFSAGDRAEIAELVARYSSAFQAGDWTAWTDLWTTDAVYQIPEAPALVGRAEILADAQTSQGSAEVDITLTDSDGSGQWAWGRAKWVSARPATEGRAVMRMEGSILWVFEKQPDGAWLIDSECYNLDAPRDLPPEG